MKVVKLLVVISCTIAVVVCAPSSAAQSRAALRRQPALLNEDVRDEFGQYAFRYVTSDGTVRHERGYLKTASNGKVIMVIEGEYQYIDDNGQVLARKYKGDETGFHIDTDFKPVKGNLAYDSEAPLQIIQTSPVVPEAPAAAESA